MMRVKARWSGFQGAPGYSVFHFREFDSAGWTPELAGQATTRVRTFFDDIKINLPAVVSIQVESDVEIIEEANGQLEGVVSAAPVAAVNGLASPSAVYAAAVGAVVTWRTGGVRNGRRIRGRTFLVPLTSAAFESNGTLAAATITGIGTAATALRNGTGQPDLGVWARPTSATANDGEWNTVTGHSIPDIGAVLRSRRD